MFEEISLSVALLIDGEYRIAFYAIDSRGTNVSTQTMLETVVEITFELALVRITVDNYSVTMLLSLGEFTYIQPRFITVSLKLPDYAKRIILTIFELSKVQRFLTISKVLEYTIAFDLIVFKVSIILILN